MKVLVLSLLILVSKISYAETKTLEEFNKFYKKGQYQNALQFLEKTSDADAQSGFKFYYSALTYSKMQEFDKAVISFEKAIAQNFVAEELYYEYGQALYATNNLKGARSAFQKSADQKNNISASLYYVGHISQILEEYNTAKNAYSEIIKRKDNDKKIDQVARFQLAETFLSMLRLAAKNNNISKDVDQRIIPMMKVAISFDSSSLPAYDIQKRIQELINEFKLDPNLLVNGKKISEKRMNSYLDVKTKFDDNVTSTNLENDVQQSHKESYFLDLEADFKYDYVYIKKFIISPEMRINFTQYSNQDESEIYQNDSMAVNLALKNKFEHLMKNSPASLIFNIEYTKSYKDYQKIHSRDSYSDATLLTFGEQLSFSSIGETSFKFKYKDLSSYSESLNNHTTTFSVDQTLALKAGHLLIVLFESSFVSNYNNISSNTNSHMLRFDYIRSEIWPFYTLTTSLATTLTDTLALKATRGFETTINPSVEISKEITKNIQGILSLDFTKNISKSTDYTYQKFVTNLELKYSF